MEDKFKEKHEDEQHIVITQDDIKKSSRNPFKADALKAMFGVVVGIVGLGLVARYTNLDDLSYFKGIMFLVEGNLAMNLVRNLKNYFGYRSYRKGIDHDVSKDFYLNEKKRIEEMYVREIEKKR